MEAGFMEGGFTEGGFMEGGVYGRGNLWKGREVHVRGNMERRLF